MTIDNRERFFDPEETMRMAMDSHTSNLWTSLPAIVTKYNPVANTVECQPSIKGVIQDKSGNYKAVTLPVLPDVPVVFPRGGGATLTFPIKEGDECLVVFACRNIDSWWQSGGVQIPADSRSHDLSDGFALMGVMSQARKISGISTKTTQLRSDDGSTYVELDHAGKKVNILAPNGVTIKTSNTVYIEAAKGVDIKGDVRVDGNVQVSGNINTLGGGEMTSTGNINTIKDVIASGISLTKHVHGGVQGGNSNTGTPK